MGRPAAGRRGSSYPGVQAASAAPGVSPAGPRPSHRIEAGPAGPGAEAPVGEIPQARDRAEDRP